MNIEQLLHQILQKIDNMQIDISGLKSDVSSLKSDVSSLKSDVSSLKSDIGILQVDVNEIKVDIIGLKASNEAIMSQTAMLTEFRTEVNEKLNQVMDDNEFLKSKEYKNEKDLFKLKQVVRLVEI